MQSLLFEGHELQHRKVTLDPRSFSFTVGPSPVTSAHRIPASHHRATISIEYDVPMGLPRRRSNIELYLVRFLADQLITL